MPLLILALLAFVLLAFGGVVLLSLVLRYRAGTSRRQARRWVVSLNMWLSGFSGLLFLLSALLLSFWVPEALKYALAGMLGGVLLGLLGLALTRWESGSRHFFYTPSRWLALLIALIIIIRFAYAWWRTLHPGNRVATEQSWWWSVSGTQLSLAVAAGLIAYYFTYAVGVRSRLLRHERRR